MTEGERGSSLKGLHRVLVLDDRPEDFELARRELERAGDPFEMERVDTRENLKVGLREFQPHLVLLDYSVPGFDGLEALRLARSLDPEIPVIMYTGTLSEETAIECLRAGADDYILKDKPARLLPAVEAALRARKHREEKRRAERSLRESEARFRGLVETAQDAIVSFDAEGTIRYVNPSGETIFGSSAQDLLGKTVDSLFHATDFRSLREQMRQKAGEEFPRTMEEPLTLRGRRSDGSVFPLELSLSGWTGPLGPEFTAIVRDVSERVEAQKALERLSRQHEFLLDSAGEGILGLDSDGTIDFLNPTALDLLGFDAEELLGKHLRFLLQDRSPGPQETRGSPAFLLSPLQDGVPFRGEVELRRKDEGLFPVATSSTPILDEGQISGLVMVFEDITERRERDEALRISEAEYRGLFEHAPLGIYRSSVGGRFLDANPALVALLGFESRDELLSADLEQDLYHDPEERTGLIRKFEDADTIVGVETRWMKADGNPITVRLTGRTLRSQDGGVEAYEMFVEDLSERRILEEQLRHAQKMEAVGQLTGGIAHDFNNVLSVILMNAELMEAAREAGDPVDASDLQAIRDAAKRASSITRKLLGFSRRAELLMEPRDLGQVVENLSSMLRTLLPETIDLSVKVLGEGGQVLVDVGAVEQMVLNLVTNSRDAMPSGGQVEVEVEETHLSEGHPDLDPEADPGRYQVVQVKDNGTGMDQEVLQRVFDPFFTTKDPGAGTGLGMSMVYGLAKQQGGFVTVESRVGEGTTTRLYFPSCQEPKKEEFPDMVDTASPALSATILLVEDDDTLRAATQRALERSGHRVLTASRGDEALERFEEARESIDLVLSDLVLPGIGGAELFREIRGRHGPVRFILTSGYSRTERLVLERQVDDSIPFIRKPAVFQDLLRVVQETLSSALPLSKF